MTHQYKKLPVTMEMWMQFNVMPLFTGRGDSDQEGFVLEGFYRGDIRGI